MERDEKLEGHFYQYMHQSGEVDSKWNREVLGYYVPYFDQCQKVLDVGCGQGDFLELLQETGVEGIGVDIDARMVDICRQKGLNATQTDVFDYLPKCKEQFDGIFNSNMIEHLSAEKAIRFVHLAFDSLTPGGLFLVATPNPASPIVHLHEFWRDATHVRLYNQSLLEFFLDWTGFIEIRSGENPVTAWKPSKALQKVSFHFKKLSSLQGAIYWKEQTGRQAGLGEALTETGASSDGKERSSGHGISWNYRRDTLITNSQKRSFLGRIVFSLRRCLARFLADTIMFEEFAALNKSLSDLTQGFQQTSKELTDVNRTLSRKFSALNDMTIIMQKIEKALYHGHNDRVVTPREVFVTGVKPYRESQENR